MASASSDFPEPFVSWTAAAPERTAEGYVTKVSIQIENPEAAENLAVLVKADGPLKDFHLFEAGPDRVEGGPRRRLRDGRELIVTSGEVAGLYVSEITTEEPSPIEVEAVLDLPGWG